mmetsp:Transcript_3587/g.5336  ORF Transcript_3587/g.5336 Transcript_3587/m.5336 type:complete len:264 (-) Transcript_3587:32-823(-)
MSKSSSLKWGDMNDDVNDKQENEEQTIVKVIKKGSEDGEGAEKLITTLKDIDGRKVKITKRVRYVKKVQRVNKAVEERKRWPRFGDCAGKPDGPERGITNWGEDVQVQTALSRKQEKKKKNATDQLGVQCRHCGAVGDHWSLKCPYKDKLRMQSEIDESKKQTTATGSEQAAKSLRDKRDELTLRITNLSSETQDGDLKGLLRGFGPIQRLFLAKDRNTGESRGFAFVTFYEKSDAARALQALDGHGFDHLILHVEWAKKQKK